MTHSTVSVPDAARPRGRPGAVPWPAAACLIALTELLAIAALAWALGENQFASAISGDAPPQALYGTFVAIAFIIVSVARRHYTLEGFLSSNQSDPTFVSWTGACLLGVAALYLLNADLAAPRVGTISFYVAGLMLVVLWRLMLRRLARAGIELGWLGARRVMLIGDRSEIDAFMRQLGDSRHGLEVVGAVAASGDGSDLSGAVEQARTLRPDRIVLVSAWSDPRRIERWLEALMTLPVTVRLAVPSRFERYRRRTLGGAAALPDLVLVRAPLKPSQRVAKRIFDLLIATIALVLLAPLLLIVGVLVRLDSPGPALFKQARRGFNHDTFFIYKFRTMAIDAEANGFCQARPDDPRITRIGRFLRRWNIDELPQLLNVLNGEMSIVGPRPHALSHESEFAGRIAEYARRHKVKPGITGWAQVNGLRGPTETQDKMRARISHDLYYIDNWSLWFDVKVVALTVLSPQAFRNAC